MKRPTVRQAHGICEALNARAVIIIALSKDNVAGASYGETKPECQQTAYTLDWIIDAINAGQIPVWLAAIREAIEEGAYSAVDRARAHREKKAAIREAIEEGAYCPHCKVPWADCDCEDRITAAQYDEGSDL